MSLFIILWDTAFENISNLEDYHFVGTRVRNTKVAFAERFGRFHTMGEGEGDGSHGSLLYLEELDTPPDLWDGCVEVYAQEVEIEEEPRSELFVRSSSNPDEVPVDGKLSDVYDLRITRNGQICPFIVAAQTEADFNNTGEPIPFSYEELDLFNAWNNTTFKFIAPHEGVFIFEIITPDIISASAIYFFHKITTGYTISGVVYGRILYVYLKQNEEIHFELVSSSWTIAAGTILFVRRPWRKLS